jgi:uncharacterized Tic20 family protein
MDPFDPAAPAPAAAPGWYPDPAGSASLRFWDGRRWTDALSMAVPPASPAIGRADSRGWALAAHLSAPLALFVALPPLGPLVVYLVKKDDPFVRRHAAEALNFNLSFLLYAFVVGALTFALLFILWGIFLIPLLLAIALVWVVCICIAAVRAGQGQEYRYPLTIRFLN